MALRPELLQERAIAAEARLQKQLENPIVIVLETWKNNSRHVVFYPPWGYSQSDGDGDFGLEEFDVTLGDDRESQVNTEGGIRLACTGLGDYYCNVGSRESRLFAWEVSTASEIADRWEEFWRDPEAFLVTVPNPQNYRLLIRR